jgi:hypothetical protein
VLHALSISSSLTPQIVVKRDPTNMDPPPQNTFYLGNNDWLKISYGILSVSELAISTRKRSLLTAELPCCQPQGSFCGRLLSNHITCICTSSIYLTFHGTFCTSQHQAVSGCLADMLQSSPDLSPKRYVSRVIFLTEMFSSCCPV